MSSEAKTMSAGPSPDPTSRPISEEAMKILEPSQRKLPSLEAQRAAGVMADCIQQVELVAMLPVVLRNLDHLSPSLNDELSAALRGHRLLEERLDRVEDPPGEIRGEEGQEEGAERPRAELEKDFRASLKNGLRQLRARPADLKAVRAEAGGAWESEGMQGLIGGLQGLHRIMVERLLTNPGKERQRARYIQDLAQRHADNLELLALLEERVAAVTKERDAKIAKKDAVIAKLQNSLQQLEKNSRDFVLRTQQDAEKQSQSDTKTWEGKQTRMQQEIDKLTLQLNTLVLENRQAEKALRKKRYKVETEIENWLQKYDADMGEKQDELQEVGGAYEEEKKELKDLGEAYSVLAVEYGQIMEEHRRAEEVHRKEVQVLGLKTAGAVVIQAWWRGHCVRKAMQPKKGKGKKGK
ncbi:unnamed protein product [Lota lota]